MFEGRGRKLDCPGNPNIATGFNEHHRWYQCWAEVFIVYANGKSNGEQIMEGDHLALFYPASPSHVWFDTNQATLSQCMRERSNHDNKPSYRAFDECTQGGLQLTIR